MPVFIPKELVRNPWKPEHQRGCIRRRCHWCAGEKHKIRSMLQVLEAPMRYFFCSEQCLSHWRQHRHDEAVVNWLRVATGERNKILKERRDAEA